MDLSRLLEPIRSTLQGTAPGSRIGVGDAARPAVIAGLAQHADGPVLVIVPKSTRVHDLAEELGYWLGPDEHHRIRVYPQRDALPYERVAEDPWDVRTRIEALSALHAGGNAIIVASIEAVAQRTLSPEAARGAVSRLTVGDRLDPDDLLRSLQSSGFEVVSLVEAPGQAARRGGIVDVFPPQAEVPARIEFFGADVESIREFDVDTQRSRDRVEAIGLGAAAEVSPDPMLAAELTRELDFSACDEETEERLREELENLARGVLPVGPAFLPALLSPYSLLDHLPGAATVLLDEPMDLSRALDEYVAETATMRIEREARGQLPIGLPAAQANWSDLQPQLERRAIELSRFATSDAPIPLPDSSSGTMRPPFGPAPGFGGRVRSLAAELAGLTSQGESVVIVSQQASRLNTLLSDEGLPVNLVEEAPEVRPGTIQLLRGSLPHGWTLRGEVALTLLTDAEVFGFVKQRRALRQPGPDRSNLVADLSPGDYVVHLEHGIARFAGMMVREVEGVEREFLELTYAEGDRLFVPVDQSDRVARYVGPGDYHPGLTRLGSGEWTRARDRVRRAVADVARDLLDLYASRQVLDGHAYSPDTPWQQELEASFPYVETPDQVAA
ncbi:MAG TPA: CarD family transcriptional regulator, partial [Dehalococcoidia bacterium]|nr:CarD family transcriptional regulator [Dehalococcoidia bacterium]